MVDQSKLAANARISIFTALYFGGLFFQFCLFIAGSLWTITAPLTTGFIALLILTIQGVALMGSGMWWLPTCAWICRLRTTKGPTS